MKDMTSAWYKEHFKAEALHMPKRPAPVEATEARQLIEQYAPYILRKVAA